MVGFFRVNIFRDSTWVVVDLFSYAIAENGTYFLAACFSTYRPLITRMKNYWPLSRLGDNEQLPEAARGQGEDCTGHGNKKDTASTKPVKGFDSILLSNIFREERLDV